MDCESNMVKVKKNILELAKYGGTDEEVDVAMKEMLTNSNFNEYIDVWGYTPLHYAAMNGSGYIIKSFLSKICSLKNISKLNGISMVFDVYAETRYGANPFQLAMIPDNRRILMRIFLSCGYDINHQNKVGDTALMLAAISNNESAVEFLLKNNALINIKNIRNMDVFAYTKTMKIKKILMLYMKIQEFSIDDNDEKFELEFKKRNLSV